MISSSLLPINWTPNGKSLSPVSKGSEIVGKPMYVQIFWKSALPVDFKPLSATPLEEGVITPSASGVADKGLKSTGSADFQKIWTYMGLPTISLPLLTGESDLPLGVQLIGNKLDDIRFLSTANWLEKNCKDD